MTLPGCRSGALAVTPQGLRHHTWSEGSVDLGWCLATVVGEPPPRGEAFLSCHPPQRGCVLTCTECRPAEALRDPWCTGYKSPMKIPAALCEHHRVRGDMQGAASQPSPPPSGSEAPSTLCDRCLARPGGGAMIVT